MKHYDFVLAGGGLAGLSLACRLARSPLGSKSMLIIDHDKDQQSDRTFSFWTTGSGPFDDAVCRSWRHMRVAGSCTEQRIDLDPYRYKTIRGRDFYRCARGLLADRPSIEFADGHIDSIEDGERAATVRFDDNEVTGTWVFDSLLEPAQAMNNGFTRLKLTFVGWEIETSEPSFDADVMTFMDFRTPQRDDLRFIYVLPFAANRALVEYTAFTTGRISGSEARAALTAYLESVVGLQQFSILSQEGGCLPVTDQPYPRRLSKRVMAVGIKGGRLKPTTGYAFTRVKADSDAIVASLLQRGHPFDVPQDEPSFRWLDSIMLRVMAKHGGDMHAIMETFFAKNPAERVLSFLDEEATPLDILQLMATLPAAKFVEAALLN